MRAVHFALVFLFVSTAPAEIIKDGPFAGVDLSLIDAGFRAAVREANEDCVAVESYRSPSTQSRERWCISTEARRLGSVRAIVS